MRRRTQGLAPGTRILIILPTSHLAQQVQDHLEKLDPLEPPGETETNHSLTLFTRLQACLNPSETSEIPTSPIVLATPKDIASYPTFPTSHLELIFTDEPDTMLGPVPTRHLPSYAAHTHPINRHPPVLLSVMNDLLGIAPEASTSKKNDRLQLDFSNRRRIQTVWTSATIHSQIRRFAKTRGWVRSGEEVVDLDFTVLASDKQRLTRDVAGRLPEGISNGVEVIDDLTRIVGVEPEHFALVVDPVTGGISHLSSTASSAVKLPSQGKIGLLAPVLLEALALLHTTSPSPAGTYVLVLPPEGTSLDALSEEMDTLSVPNILLTPEAIASGLPGNPGLLLARRSTITGLHLAGLHTIYLLSGLDLGGLSTAQKRGQGQTGRTKFYEIVSGRVGRLGTSAVVVDEGGEGMSKQRVVSLVLGGSEEERGLIDLFFVEDGRMVGDEGSGSVGKDEEKKVVVGRKLGRWDLEGIEKALEGELDEGEAEDEQEEQEEDEDDEGLGSGGKRMNG